MSQKLVVDSLELREDKFRFHEKFIQNHDEDGDKGYALEVDVKYSKELHELHSNLPFLSKRIKILKCEKLLLQENYVIHTKSPKSDIGS